MEDGKIRLCNCCILAIRCRGEKVFVGSSIDPDEFEEENGETLTCEWCEESDIEIFDCRFD